MRVAKYYNNTDVRLEELPTPQIGDEELLVKIIASGICGSDVMEWYRIKKAPLVLGHEITGEVEKVGVNVKQFKIGDRVCVSHHVPCNCCQYCLNGQHTVCDTLRTTNFDPGGFSEYVRVPKINVDRGTFLIPDEISFDEGTFIEPLACVVRAQRVAAIRPNDSVLVLGSGISGLIHIALTGASRTGRIIATDIDDYRLEMAKKMGADNVVNAKENVVECLKECNANRLADVVIVCAGAPSAFEQALQCVDRGGTILFFASTEPGYNLPLPVFNMWKDGIKLITSYGASPKDITESIGILRSHKIDFGKMITHRLKLEETAMGFQLVAGAKDSVKVIIEPHK
ncbi:MAG: alcohol dehydrogenase catalytic domain-containing protein [Candidatus Anammoxibacter sp.]